MATDKKSESASGSTVGEFAPEVDDVAEREVEEEGEASPDVDTEEETEELPLDVIFEILRNRRRQLVLEYLREQEATATIGELAEHIAAIENDTTVRQLNAQQRKRVYIGLYQCHLPKMDDVNVIDFNQSRGNVEPGKHIEPLYDYLDVANGDTDDEADDAPFEPKHGVGLGALGVAFFVAQFAGAYMLASAFVLALLAGTLAVVARGS